MIKIWDDKAWARHLELAKVSGHYMMEQEWGYYWMDNVFEQSQDAEYRCVILNHKYNIEFSQTFTRRQMLDMNYGTKLLRSLDFINWMGGL